jgi:ATP-dependent helicase/DNAse subunit B
MVIEKSESVMLRLKEIADIGFHHRRWRGYIRNQFSFFQRYCESGKLKKLKRISLEHLGTIIHETLKSLYDPFVGRFISESDIQNCFKQIDDEVLKQFKSV